MCKMETLGEKRYFGECKDINTIYYIDCYKSLFLYTYLDLFRMTKTSQSKIESEKKYKGFTRLHFLCHDRKIYW